jgi:adenosine deaminase
MASPSTPDAPPPPPPVALVPTVELHRHFEAGLTPEILARLAAKNGVTTVITRQGAVVPGVDPQEPDSIRAYYAGVAAGFAGAGGFSRFIDSFGLPLSVLCSLEDLTDAVCAQLLACAQAGALHTELRGSPASYQECVRAPVEEILQALRAGARRAWEQHGVSGTFIAAFSRQNGLGPSDGPPGRRQAPAVVRAAVALHSDDDPCPIDIAGFPELTFPPRLFVDVLAPAREAGVPLTIHCGEQGLAPDFEEAPAWTIREAVELLGARRVGHGTSIIADAEVQALVRERAVGVECCPGSNAKMGFMALTEHPLRAFLDAGMLATISTDDPLMFGHFTVQALVEDTHALLGLDEPRLWRLAENGVATAFVSNERRALLAARLAAARAAATPGAPGV